MHHHNGICIWGMGTWSFPALMIHKIHGYYYFHYVNTDIFFLYPFQNLKDNKLKKSWQSVLIKHSFKTHSWSSFNSDYENAHQQNVSIKPAIHTKNVNIAPLSFIGQGRSLGSISLTIEHTLLEPNFTKDKQEVPFFST